MSGSNSFHEIYLHLAWSCRGGAPLIRPSFELELNKTLRSYLTQLPGVFFKSSGNTSDHIHVAVQMEPTEGISDLVAHIKGASAQRINKKYGADTLVWQHGYSVASFSAENLKAVENYIHDQRNLHERKITRTALEASAEGETKNEVFLHATWHCHDNRPMITPELEERIRQFLPGYCSEFGIECIGMGGTETHMHVAFKPALNMKISDAIGKMKGATTYHINSAIGNKALKWQHGYGVVSFAGKNSDRVLGYIANQKEHHRKLTIDEILERCGFDTKGAEAAEEAR